MRHEIEEALKDAYDTSFGVAVVPKHWFSQCRHLVERNSRRPPLPLEHLPKDSPILESDKLLHISLPCALQLSMIVGGTVSFTHHYHYNGGTLVNEKFNHIVYMAVGLWPKGEIASAATPETEEKTMKKVWVNTRITVKEAVMKGLRFEPARAQSLSDGADIALDSLMWDWWKDDLSKILYIFSKKKEREATALDNDKLPERTKRSCITPRNDFWPGKPIKTISDEMDEDLDKIQGISTYGLDADKLLVVYCNPQNVQESREKFEHFYKKYGVGLCVIYQTLNIMPAVDQAWTQTAAAVGAPYGSTCAIGLPVRVRTKDNQLGGYIEEPGLLGCCHCLLHIVDSVGERAAPRQQVVNGSPVLTTEVTLDTQQFLAHFHGNVVPLGRRAKGSLGERADVALTYLEPPRQVIATPPWPCDNYIMTQDEVVDLAHQPVWKKGPVTRDTFGQVLYTDQRFFIDSGVEDIPVTRVKGAIVVKHHLEVDGLNPADERFARLGDSASVVFCRRNAGDRRAKLLGAVSAIHDEELLPDFKKGLFVPTSRRTFQDGASALTERDDEPLLHQEQNRERSFHVVKGATWVVPYCHQIAALRQHFNVEIEVMNDF